MYLSKEDYDKLIEIGYHACNYCGDILYTFPYFEGDFNNYMCMECYDKASIKFKTRKGWIMKLMGFDINESINLDDYNKEFLDITISKTYGSDDCEYLKVYTQIISMYLYYMFDIKFIKGQEYDADDILNMLYDKQEKILEDIKCVDILDGYLHPASKTNVCFALYGRDDFEWLNCGCGDCGKFKYIGKGV